MNCIHCGAEMTPGAPFCSNCGRPQQIPAQRSARPSPGPQPQPPFEERTQQTPPPFGAQSPFDDDQTLYTPPRPQPSPDNDMQTIYGPPPIKNRTRFGTSFNPPPQPRSGGQTPLPFVDQAQPFGEQTQQTPPSFADQAQPFGEQTQQTPPPFADQAQPFGEPTQRDFGEQTRYSAPPFPQDCAMDASFNAPPQPANADPAQPAQKSPYVKGAWFVLPAVFLGMGVNAAIDMLMGTILDELGLSDGEFLYWLVQGLAGCLLPALVLCGCCIGFYFAAYAKADPAQKKARLGIAFVPLGLGWLFCLFSYLLRDLFVGIYLESSMEYAVLMILLIGIQVLCAALCMLTSFYVVRLLQKRLDDLLLKKN